ncbi:uncharacterized protein LOC119958660 isoform X2 [Scyliorhinus canicula]|uniref:uncharacterized protein LOC119958660 isoform X2 n=1 Tax=Scyliorhinus canicula TaxID=7830 RepID=UPI0018F488BD|nr:uncharacterized protein LOC119958660 isoform X2 [Scyliorhinus canicula]
MAKEYVSLILIFQILRVNVAESESSMNQIPFVMTSEIGQTVELSCQSSYQVILVSSYFWYKQRVDEAPILIDTGYCKGADCKFISKEGNMQNVLILEIRNVQANDSGSYYCAHLVSYAPLQKAARLLVGDSSTNKTAVLIFVPQGEEHSRETVPLVCLVSGLTSNRIAIFWNISGFVSEGASDPGRLETDGSYSIRSHVMLSREIWRAGDVCTCIVQLGSPGTFWIKSVSFPKAAETWIGWCNQARPVFITVLVILILLLTLLSIWILKSGRSGERHKGSHNENFSLRATTQRRGQTERQTDENRQTQAQRAQDDALRAATVDAVIKILA